MTDLEKNRLLGHIRPVHLVTVLTLYAVGAGLAHYLGALMDPLVFGLGLAWILCLYLGIFLLGDHYRVPFEAAVLPAQGRLRQPGRDRNGTPANLLLFGSLALLSAAAVLTLLMGLRGEVTPAVGAIMAGSFGFSALAVLPGLRIRYSGIGEFLVSICLVLFPPALGFFTQYGEFHRFLTLTVFPLFPLHLALILTLRLRSYGEDLRAGRKTLLVRMGWVRGVFLHNLLLLSAFFLFGAAILFGIPLRIVGPVFLTLLPAGYLIWLYSGLEHGAPVRWPVIIFLELVVFFLPVYLMGFTAWIF